MGSQQGQQPQVPAKKPVSRTEMIERKIDRTAASALSISSDIGGVAFTNMGELLEFSKLMSISLQAVPKHCRDQPGVCLGICIQAVEWRMSPYAVANKSYVVNDRISYESQLIHAVIEQRAPITTRLRHRFTGEGDKRRCIVWATCKGEEEPLEYTSPEFVRIQPKNSPLWTTKPDLQLFYNASRDWARMYFPDVIMGVYSVDELEDMPGTQALEQIPAGGIKGLKSKIAGVSTAEVEQHEAPEDEPEYEEEFEEDSDLDDGECTEEQGDGEPESPEQPSEGAPSTDNPAGMTPEEEADQRREQQARGGKLFDTHGNVGQ